MSASIGNAKHPHKCSEFDSLRVDTMTNTPYRGYGVFVIGGDEMHI